jgi:hypothetical protein
VNILRTSAAVGNMCFWRGGCWLLDRGVGFEPRVAVSRRLNVSRRGGDRGPETDTFVCRAFKVCVS